MPNQAGPVNPVEERPRYSLWSWFFSFVGMIGWITAGVLGVLLHMAWRDQADYYDTTGGVYERYHSGDEDADQKIAIIDVRGVIVDGHSVLHQIERIRKDKTVKAIVLRVESPGGTVTGSDFIYHHLCKLRDEREIPMVVSMGSIAASGGYYISMCVGETERSIFAEPTTVTGSIGVVLPRYDVSALMEEHGVIDDSIRSHPNKQMLSMTRSLDESQRQIVQAQIDESFERFKVIILAGRPLMGQQEGIEPNDEEVVLVSNASGEDIATGQVFTSTQAIRHGLVDEVGFIEDAIERAAELADLDVDKTRVIRYAKPKPLIELPSLIQADEKAALLSLLSRPSHPQAWYIVGNLPPLMPWRDEFEAYE